MFIDLQQEKHSIKINNLISMTLYHFYLSLGFIKIIAHLKINWRSDFYPSLRISSMCDDWRENIADYKLDELLIGKQFEKPSYKNQFPINIGKFFLLLDMRTFTYLW